MSCRPHRVSPLVAVLLCGCTLHRVSDPPRTATEQLLITTAADRAIGRMGLSALDGKRVFVDPSHLDGYDKAYVLGAVIDRLGRQGARLVKDEKQAEVIATVRAGALSVDRSEFLVGLPSIPVPVPFAGPAQLPELALLKRQIQTGIAKLALTAHDAATGKPVLSVGPTSADSHLTLWRVLLVPFRLTDIPEKRARR